MRICSNLNNIEPGKVNAQFSLISVILKDDSGEIKNPSFKNGDGSCLVAGTGFISPRCSEMGQGGEQPKETSIALQSDLFFCSQDDASIP